ncbi:MAG: hypothetical protein RJA07_913 [Bacteroidota bacterium]|jgi:photosystem II stability/assembly factor-like uncharacterized protein
MKQNLIILLIAFSLTASFVQAQTWTKYGTGISSPGGVCIVDISAPSTTVAWGIFSLFSSGSCGGQVPYFTKTTNGINWVAGAISALPINETPTCIFALNDTIAWITVADISTNTTGSIYKTSNGGNTWQLQTSANSIDAARFIHFFDANQGVSVGDSSVFITTDGGTNWLPSGALPVPVANIGSGKTIILLNAYEVVGNTIWIGDSYGYFYKSIDKGNTWTLMPNAISPSAIKGIAFRDQNYGIAVASQFIGGGSGSSGGGYADYSVYTTNGGVSWNPMLINFSSPSVANGEAKYDVGYVPGTANTFIVSSEYDSTFAAFTAITIDGGTTWSLLDSTERHTACAFTSPTSGFTGGYIPTFGSGIYKLNVTLPSTGFENLEPSATFLYPNPVADFVTIELPKQTLLNHIYIKVTDVTGREIQNLHTTIAAQQLSVDVSEMPHGLYFIQLSTESKRIGTYKFIH